MSEKLNKGETLMNMANLFATEEMAKEQPFILTMKMSDDGENVGIGTRVCANGEDMLALACSVIQTVVKSLKSCNISDGECAKILAKVSAKAMAKVYLEDDEDESI